MRLSHRSLRMQGSCLVRTLLTHTSQEAPASRLGRSELFAPGLRSGRGWTFACAWGRVARLHPSRSFWKALPFLLPAE
jgi:hypothetical protein